MREIPGARLCGHCRLHMADLKRLRLSLAKCLPFVTAADHTPRARLLEGDVLRERFVPLRQLEMNFHAPAVALAGGLCDSGAHGVGARGSPAALAALPLEELHEAAFRCRACPLWERATRTVNGGGRETPV